LLSAEKSVPLIMAQVVKRKAKGSLVARNAVKPTKPKRKFHGKQIKGTAVARGCGVVLPTRRKRTKGSVEQS
jgi:hypothetical protein